MASAETTSLKVLIREVGLPSEQLYFALLDVDHKVKFGENVDHVIDQVMSNGVKISRLDYDRWIGLARDIDMTLATQQKDAKDGGAVRISVVIDRKDHEEMKRIFKLSGMTVSGQVELAIDLYLHGYMGTRQSTHG